MTAPVRDLREILLRDIAAAAPRPWFPSHFVQATGIPRDELAPPLDKLRRADLIYQTDWVQDNEHGYALTLKGLQAVRNGQDLAGLRDGSSQREPAPLPPAVDPLLRHRAEAIRTDLTGPAMPLVTWALLLANIAVFGYGLYFGLRHGAKLKQFYLSSPKIVLEETGAVNGEYLVSGQWWRLLTNCFVHIGLLHLFVNMFSLYAVGPLLERMWGHARFLVLYLIAGLGGSCALLMENPLGGGAGASGALWGIVASMATWLFLNRRVLPRSLIRDMRRNLLIVFLLNVAITFAIPQISKGAHFGGGLVGLLVAVPLHYQRYGHGWQRGLALAGIVAVPVLCLAALDRTEMLDKRWQVLFWQKEKTELRRISRQVEEMEQRAEKIYQKYVTPLIRIDPEFRNPAGSTVIEEAVETLAKGQDLVADAADLLAKAGPYRTPEIEAARQAGLRYYTEEAKLFALARDYLEQEKQVNEAFRQEESQVEKLGKEWRVLLARSMVKPDAP